MSASFISRFFCLFLWFLYCFSSEAAVTRFEFIEPPNQGEQNIVDDNGNLGPTILPSFKATIVETPADFIMMNQLQTEAAASLTVSNIPDPDEGFDTPTVPLFEGVTFLYPYAKNPSASSEPWVLGPLTIDGALPLLFRVDQGPPRAPQIGGFNIDGARTQNLQDPNINAHFVNFTPSNNEFLLEVVFNAHDIQNAASLEVSFIGTVLNNTALFDADPGTEPNPDPFPGSVDRPEALADVVAQLGRILSGVPDTGPPLSVEVIGDVTTKTGPFPLDVPLVDVDPPTNSDPPDITPAKSGPGLGLFNPLGFDFKTLNFDGNFEIVVGARDTVLNVSPGGFNAFGNLANPEEGTPARILVIKDTASPQDLLLERPRSIFIFGNTPPSVDPPFEDSIWSLRGSVNDERGDLVQVRVFSQDSPDIDAQLDGSNGLPDELILTTDPSTGILESIIDATSWSPQSTSTGQVAYRLGFAPQDLHGNINVANNTELLAIKDFFPPSTPIFTNLQDGDAISTSIFTIEAVAENDEASINAEHGRMNFELFVTLLTNSGPIPIFSVSPPASTSDQIPVTNSLLDDQFLAFTRTMQVNDSNGVFTGQTESIEFLDRTSAFDNLVYDKFYLEQAINFTNVPDGIIRLDLCLLDQVGNRSDPCTSIAVIKDTTGPTINLDLPESGPDDNYTTGFPTLPNFFGADNNEFLISLKSPEFTVDDGPGGSFPDALVPDPSYEISGISGADSVGLLLRGLSEENFGNTTRIDISSARIPSFSIFDDDVNPTGTNVDFSYKGNLITVSQPSFSVTQSATFELRIPVFNLREGLQEVIRLEAIDDRGNKGAAFNLTVVRDVVPPSSPVVEQPGIPPGFSKPTHYTNQDVMDISGITEPDARLVLLLPPLGAPPGFDINQGLRIQRTSPSNIPIVGSDYDSVTSACANLTCSFIEADSEGRFQLTDLDISTIASSLTTATTIYVQAIDSFDNTDPVSSIAEIIVHRNKLQVPVDFLYVSEYPDPGLSNRVEIFPDSANAMPGLTVFYTVDYVKMRLETLFPMLEAPDLELRQSGNVFRPAGKVTSVFSAQIGTFAFDYVYDVFAKVSDFDGRVDFKISGGQDLFGNPVIPTSGPIAFLVDTVAPNEFSSSPIIVLSPTDSTLVTTFVSARIDLTDFFKNELSSSDTSGVNTGILSLELFGPLQQTPDSLNSISVTTFIPTEVGFDVAGSLQSPLSTDGTYRLEFTATDKVGNSVRHRRTFLLDRQNIVQPLLVTTPENQSFINSMPSNFEFGSFNLMRVEDIEVDMNASDFEIRGPNNQLLDSVSTVITSDQSIVRSLVNTAVPATDGTSDGIYQLDLTVFDKTGNRTSKTHNYIYDTLPPEVTFSFPQNGQCISSLTLAKFQAIEDSSYTTNVSGLDRGASQISLRLLEPTEPFNSSSIGRVILSTIDFLSEDSDPLNTETVAMVLEEGELPRGGEYDGLYELSADIFDLAGNKNSSSTSFLFDSRAPSLSVSGFGDLDYLTNQQFVFSGTLQDQGPCGLKSSGFNEFETSHLKLEVFNYDMDSEITGSLIAGPFFSESIMEIESPTYPIESSQGSYLISGSFPGGVDSAIFRFSFRDRAGNEAILERVANLKDQLPQFPKRNYPLAATYFRGQNLTTFVTSPLQILNWSAVPEATTYRLHLSRESITPGVRTTFIDLPEYVTNYSVDYSLINSVAGIVPLTDRDQFYWLVESLDGIGQGSDPNQAFGRGEKLEFDQMALPFSESQVMILRETQELPLDSVNTFASGTSIHFRWSSPEPVRLFGDESVYIHYDRDHTQQHNTSFAEQIIETDILDFHFPMPDRQVNGTATLFLEGFRDRAGNDFGSSKVVFKIDNGPEVQVKVFQNPVDPTSFGFVFKGLDYHGLDDILRYDIQNATPQVFISEGFRNLEELTVIPLRQTFIDGKEYANGFSGSFNVSRQFIGDVTLEFIAEDFRGFKSKQQVVLHVLPIEPKYDTSIARIGKSGATLNYKVLEGSNYSSQLVATPRKYVDLTNLPPSQLPSKRLTLSDFVHFFGPESLWVEQQGSISIGKDCDKAIFMKWKDSFRPLLQQNLICDAEGSLSYSIQTTDPTRVFLMQDMNAPELDLNDEEELLIENQQIEISSQDDLSGVSQVWVEFEKKRFELQATDNEKYRGSVKFPPGKWAAQIFASDNAGNMRRSQMMVNVLKPFDFERCFIAPNPLSSTDQINLHCSATRKPDEVVISLYDSSGKRVNHWQGSEEVVFRESYEPVNSRGSYLSNGVYFLRVRIREGNAWRKKTLKLAIIKR